MKQYIATFIHKGKLTRTETTVRCDGVSDNHARARAWIKHMDSLVFKNDYDNWELISLTQA